jgi:heat shock protein HslJ
MRRVSILAILLVAFTALAAACSGGGNALTGTTWQLTAVTEQVPAFQGVVPAEDQIRYTVRFDSNGTYSGQADCNVIAGTYTTSGSDGITINAGPSTLVACPEDSFGPLFAHALTTATTWKIANDQLTLSNADGATMTFAKGSGSASAAPSAAEASEPAQRGEIPADLTANPWQLTGMTEKVPAFQGVVPAEDQSKYTIAFAADGTFQAQADCNAVGGSFSVKDGLGLTIEPGPSTLVACPEGSMGDLFVIGLSKAESFVIADGQLTINLDDGGTLSFAPGA